MKIGVIGAGKLAQGIISGWIETKTIKRSQIWAITKSKKSAIKVAEKFKISCDTAINAQKLNQTNIIILAAKPYHLEDMCSQLKTMKLKKGTIIYSVLAGVSTKQIEKALGQKNPVIVCMTNTPCMKQAGMTTLFKGRYANKNHLATASKLFSKIGLVETLTEKHFHEVTALTGSGPAFVYYIMKLFSDNAKKNGLPSAKADMMTAQTFLGASTMLLESNEKLEKLISNVTTPGGCTIEGLRSLQTSKLSPAIKDCLKKTINKSKTLAK